MKTTKILASAIAAILAVGSLAGCTGSSSSASQSSGTAETTASSKDAASTEPVNLVYYTIGNPDNDLQMVNDALNKMLKEKINVTIEYNKIAWGDYGTKISALVNSGAAFDLAFATGPDQGDYVGNAKKGAWLALDDYFTGEGKAMYDAINPLLWEGMKIDGKTYGIPTNKEVAVPEQWMYPKELVDKYKLDITQYKTLESLEPVFKDIKAKEADYTVMELDKNSHNFFALDGYEWVINRDLPLMIKSSDKDLKIVNIFDTDTGKKTLDTLRKYYKAGYINEDAAVKEAQGLEKGKKVFLKEAGGGPYSETSWSADRGYDVVAQQVTDTVVTTESARGGVMVVNALTKNADACIKFLNCLNTDADVRNLINYGIEGTHYNLTSDGQVEKVKDTTYSGVQYTQGNWFILKTLKGDPADKWKTFEDFNSKAVKSEALGFTPDTTKVASQLAAISTVSGQYYSGLMTGTVDPATELPKFLEALKTAGINDVMKEFQTQLDAWKASK